MAKVINEIVFTSAEIEALKVSPGALRALADHHSVQENVAEAMDAELCAPECEYHKTRSTALRAEADRIQAIWES
jgi:hypothetical protein